MKSIRFTAFPRTDGVCMGCGRFLKKSAAPRAVLKDMGLKGEPRIDYARADGSHAYLCLFCAYLAALRTGDKRDADIRTGEFDRDTMANIHKRHLAELEARLRMGEKFTDLLAEAGLAINAKNGRK